MCGAFFVDYKYHLHIYMHGCLLGVLCRTLKLGLKPVNHKQKFYIGQLSSLLDCQLLSINLPAEILRAPRPLSDLSFFITPCLFSKVFYL